MKVMKFFLVLGFCFAYFTHPVNAQSGGQLQPGQPIKDSLSANNVDTWSFEGVQGQIAFITAESVSYYLNPDMELYDMNGTMIASNGDYGGSFFSFLGPIFLPTSGTYQLQVKPAQPDTSGGYELELTAIDSAPVEALTPADESVEAFVTTGWAELERLNSQGALMRFGQALELQPDYAEAYRGRATALLFEGDTDQAMSAAGYAYELDPNSSESYRILADVLIATNNYQQAQANLTRALEIDPSNAQAYNSQGRLFYEQDLMTESIEQFTRSLELEPHSFTYLNRSQAYQTMGLSNYSVYDVIEATLIAPSSPDIYLKWARFHLNMGFWSAALASYDVAIMLDPTYTEAYLQKAELLIRFGEGAAAVELAEQVLQMDPELEDRVAFIHGLANRNSDLEAAIASFGQAIESNPDYIDAYFERGVAYYLSSQYENAIADMTRVLQDRPQDAWVYDYRGLSYQGIGQNQRAIEDLRYAITLAPFNTSFQIQLGDLYLAQTQYAEAYLLYERALSIANANTYRPNEEQISSLEQKLLELEPLMCFVQVTTTAELYDAINGESQGSLEANVKEAVLGRFDGEDGAVWWWLTMNKWVRGEQVVEVGNCDQVRLVTE